MDEHNVRQALDGLDDETRSRLLDGIHAAAVSAHDWDGFRAEVRTALRGHHSAEAAEVLDAFGGDLGLVHRVLANPNVVTVSDSETPECGTWCEKCGPGEPNRGRCTRTGVHRSHNCSYRWWHIWTP